jgi:hypothetical protein
MARKAGAISPRRIASDEEAHHTPREKAKLLERKSTAMFYYLTEIKKDTFQNRKVSF